MIGTVAGSYRIVDTISVGGMGTVYRAEHTLLGRMAAVKVLNPEMSTSREIVNRFFNEARATTSIKHPGIIEVFDFGYLQSGHAYLVMELLEGAPLSTRNKVRGPIPEYEAAAILRGICSALTAAHAKGIVHRDLKPDNIFLIADPDSQLGERPKLLDFGIAKLTDIGLAGTATKTGAVMGTPTYMSPEQCKGTGDVDHRADLYSLGCIFYELVTGRPPFTDRGAGELIGAHLFMQPEPPSRYMHGLSPESEALIMALLAKNPNDRPQTAAELAQRLVPIAARGGYGSAAHWEGMRASLPYVTAQPSDVTRHPTPGGSIPMPTPMRGPMPTPMGGMPMPTPMGGPMPTPMGMPTPMSGARSPTASTTDPTTLSGAASQVSHPGGSKRVLAIAGAVVLVGAAAVAFAFTRGGSASDDKAAQDKPAQVEPAKEPVATPTPAPMPTQTAPTATPTPPPTAVAAPTPDKPASADKPAASTDKPIASTPDQTAASTDKPIATSAPDKSKPTKPTTAAKPTTTTAKPAKPAKPTKPTKSDNPLLETDVD